MGTRPLRRYRHRRPSGRLRLETLEERRLLAVCDPNDDGEVSRTDIAILAAHYGTKEGATEREGDCNADGSIDLFDAGLMQAHLFGRRLDWGDAPRPYPTLFAGNGARHVIREGFHLGASIDRDPNGQPSVLATGDDTDIDGDDEDGVFFLAPAVPGLPQKLRVDASAPGLLDAFFDFNRDGDWDDAGEQIFTNEPLVAGPNFLSHLVPAASLTDKERPTYARFRFSSAGGLTPRGTALDGEVEDYAPFVLAATDVPPSTRHTILWDAQADLRSANSDEMVHWEAAGPAEFRIGPAINTDNGMPAEFLPAEFLPQGSWHIDTELASMNLSGSAIIANGLEILGIAWGGPTMAPLMGSADLVSDGHMISGMSGKMAAMNMQFLALQEATQMESRRFEATTAMPAEFLPATFDGILEAATNLSYMAPPPVDVVMVEPPQALVYQLLKWHTEIPRRRDWGDAPDPPYPTLAASAGATHVIRPGYSMGPAVDAEANGQPSPLATRDDTAGVPDDEDGVVITSPIVPGGMTTVDVTAVGGRGYLNAWADFNRNGVWEASEQIFTDLLLNMGVNGLAFPVPAATLPDAAGIPPVISRWRFSRQKGLPTTGLSSSGEVEDHLLRIQPAAVEVDAFPETAAEMVLRYQDGSTQQFDLAGPTTVHVMFEGLDVGVADDDDLDGLDEVDTEIVSMSLLSQNPEGAQRLGRVDLWGRPFEMYSRGRISERLNNVSSILDVSPFVNQGTADSFVNMFLAVDLPVGPAERVLHTNAPVYVEGQITHKPPAEGETLCTRENAQPVDLYDENNNPTGISISRFCHTYRPRLDFGDAPDPKYPTLSASNGARHIIKDGFHLGAALDRDPDGQPSLAANGDDTDADGDDEDGVFFMTAAVPGMPQRVRVDASAAGLLDAFVDLNRDGDWDDAGEKIFASQPLAAGSNFLSYPVPTAAVPDATRPTYSRFRLSSTGGLTPRGLARDGEVEDYTLFIVTAANVPSPTRYSFVWDARADLDEPCGGLTCFDWWEATGPAEMLIGPAINMDNGLPDNGMPNNGLPDGLWHIPIELCSMSLAGAIYDPQSTIPIDDIMVSAYPGDPCGNKGGMDVGVANGLINFLHLQAKLQIEVRDSVSVYFNPKEISIDKSVPWEKRPPTIPTFEIIFSEATMFDYMAPPAVDFVPVQSPGTLAFQLTRLQVEIPPRLDWGDAPDRPYPTLAASAGARHVIRPGYSMGPAIDAEADGQPSPLATRDDTTGLPDDEDGVVFTSAIVPGGVATVNVTAVGGRGYLNAWADFNRNGVWEASEHIFTDVLLNMGVNPLAFAVPAATLPDAATLPPVISRWRFSRQSGLATTGLSSSGEVEDHLLRIAQPAIEVDTFSNASATFVIVTSTGASDTVVVRGPMTMRVQFEGAQEGIAFDHDGDGLDDADAEIVSMNLQGTSALFGAVTVRQSAAHPSLGQIEETANLTAGNLDGPPFAANGMFDSSFDVFLDVDVPASNTTVQNFPTPVRLTGRLAHKPPAAGETLRKPANTPAVSLLNPNGTPTGVAIREAALTPIPLGAGAPEAAPAAPAALVSGAVDAAVRDIRRPGGTEPSLERTARMYAVRRPRDANVVDQILSDSATELLDVLRATIRRRAIQRQR